MSVTAKGWTRAVLQAATLTGRVLKASAVGQRGLADTLTVVYFGVTEWRQDRHGYKRMWFVSDVTIEVPVVTELPWLPYGLACGSRGDVGSYGNFVKCEVTTLQPCETVGSDQSEQHDS